MVVYNMSQKELDHMIDRLHLEYMDVVSGCMLDNLMLSSPTLLVLVNEKYLNCWSSCYHVSISESVNDDIQLWNEWEELQSCI